MFALALIAPSKHNAMRTGLVLFARLCILLRLKCVIIFAQNIINAYAFRIITLFPLPSQLVVRANDKFYLLSRVIVLNADPAALLQMFSCF